MAALLCALPIVLGLEPGETSLVKLLFFPLAWRVVCDKLVEVGLLPKFWGGEVLGYMLACFLIPYTYMLEPRSSSPAMYKLVLTYSRDPYFENRGFHIVKSAVRANIFRQYLSRKQ